MLLANPITFLLLISVKSPFLFNHGLMPRFSMVGPRSAPGPKHPVHQVTALELMIWLIFPNGKSTFGQGNLQGIYVYWDSVAANPRNRDIKRISRGYHMICGSVWKLRIYPSLCRLLKKWWWSMRFWGITPYFETKPYQLGPTIIGIWEQILRSGYGNGFELVLGYGNGFWFTLW